MKRSNRFCRSVFLFVSISVAMLSNIAWSSFDGESISEYAKEERIYVHPEQIEITAYGIIAWVRWRK